MSKLFNSAKGAGSFWGDAGQSSQSRPGPAGALLLALGGFLWSSGIAGAIVIDGNFDDWLGLPPGPAPVVVTDPADLPDSSGDIREIQAVVEGDELVLSMTVEGIITPSVEQTPEGKT
ncbi:MAG TPA: hypothetical protein VMN36_15675, partial [Verrucomicrobiales bacterium]|nr:hypothetical protein [Verrucomicrobiales bacterium]